MFLAHSLGARGRLAKDVDGVYESDPSETLLAPPRRFAELNYADALRVAGPLIQPKAVSYLQRHSGQAEVAGLTLPYQSVVHAGSTALAHATSHPPLSVLLLGLGTVGFGVYQRLLANARHFRVVGILVRDRAKYEAQEIPAHLLHVGDDALRTLRPDLVVDALPGIEPSREFVERFLAAGAAVVCANKALLAEYGALLAAQANRSDSSFCYSAAVGGSTPMIEAVSAAAARTPLQSIAGVLNGTCNFVLDRCAGGAKLDHALADARQRGFAEENASEDLSGRDAERKLRILARHAFSEELSDVDVEALTEGVAELARDAAATGVRLRQVARAWREGKQLRGTVKLERLPADGALGALAGEWNGLEIKHTGGHVITVTGRGAGRWPTTESVMADLFDVLRRKMPETSRDRGV